jgi:MFS family permease
VLLLLGGVAADRLDPRRMLIVLHGLAALPSLALALAVSTGHLSFGGVVGYGVALGVTTAFMMPARDAVLSTVAGANMVRAVTTMTLVQFTLQGAGTLLAGTAEWLGSAPVLVFQGLLLASGAAFALGLPTKPASAVPPARDERALQELTAGVREVWRSPILRATAALVISVGLFFIGPFLVVFPLLVRDVYAGGVDQLAIVLMLFPAGTILGSIVLRARGGLSNKVVATMCALACGALLLIGIGTGVSFPIFAALTLGWGLAGSVFINASRVIFQEEAPPSHRARVLSVYQLGLMGGAPIGSLLSGFASGAVGPRATLIIFGSAMLLLVAIVWWRIDSEAVN